MIRTLAALLMAATFAATTSRVDAAPTQDVFHFNAAGERAVGYAQAVRVGDTIYVSGTVARGASLAEQLAGACERIRLTLEHYGATFADVVKETIYTTDFDALRSLLRCSGCRQALGRTTARG